MLFPLMAIILVEVGRNGLAVGAEADQENEYYKRLYDFGLGKRAAYSYVSEYKRLPVYNFGLGKRSVDGRPYSFGLGKRADESDYEDEEEDYAKRSRQYAFGLGKRLPGGKSYSFGLGKRAEGRIYSFGLGKRSDEDYDVPEVPSNIHARSYHYNFGLGKRARTQEEPPSLR